MSTKDRNMVHIHTRVWPNFFLQEFGARDVEAALSGLCLFLKLEKTRKDKKELYGNQALQNESAISWLVEKRWPNDHGLLVITGPRSDLLVSFFYYTLPHSAATVRHIRFYI